MTGHPFRKLVDQALPMWEDLTGVSMDQTSWKLGELDVEQMNRMIKKALKLEEDGTTAYFLLECCLRHHLENTAFTVAEIMKDYAALQDYLRKSRDLFQVLQSDEAAEHSAIFRNRLKKALEGYGADTPENLAMVDDPDALPFLRRDAIYSVKHLKPCQFLKGGFGKDPKPKLASHVYQAWDVNELLPAMRDMKVNGVAVALVRDPANPDQSYFGFCMRNGDNAIFFTDRDRPAYPGQHEHMRGRGRGRDFISRMWSHRFPYQLLNPQWNAKGDVWFDPVTQPVMHGEKLVPVLPFSKLEPAQAVWLAMTMALVSDKFWKREWQAEELHYTGKMVVDENMLVSKDGEKLPAAKGYQPLGVKPLELEDVSKDKILEQTEFPSHVNQWLEDRYAKTVDPAVLNQMTNDDDEIKALPALHKPERRWHHGRVTESKPRNEIALRVETHSKRELDKTLFWKKPGIYKLKAFADTNFGTKKELEDDRAFTARYNLAKHVQREADREHQDRKSEIRKWFEDRIEANKEELARRAVAEWIRQEEAGDFGDKYDLSYVRNGVTMRKTSDEVWDHASYFASIMLGEWETVSYPKCAIRGTSATWRAIFVCLEAKDVADACGVGIEDLPDVLQNWAYDKRTPGNSILNRIDPMEWALRDPWMHENFNVGMLLSKTAMNQIRKSMKEDA